MRVPRQTGSSVCAGQSKRCISYIVEPSQRAIAGWRRESRWRRRECFQLAISPPIGPRWRHQRGRPDGRSERQCSRHEPARRVAFADANDCAGKAPRCRAAPNGDECGHSGGKGLDVDGCPWLSDRGVVCRRRFRRQNGEESHVSRRQERPGSHQPIKEELAEAIWIDATPDQLAAAVRKGGTARQEPKKH